MHRITALTEEVKLLVLGVQLCIYSMYSSMQSADGRVGTEDSGWGLQWSYILALRASLTARNMQSGEGKSVSCIFGRLSSVCSHKNVAQFNYLFTPVKYSVFGKALCLSTYFVHMGALSLHFGTC